MVEDADAGNSRQPPIQEDEEEMNDAELEGEAEPADANMEDEQEPRAEAAARQHHMAQLEQRRDQAITQRINQRILAAWERGHPLPPELEAYLKEQSERGDTDLSGLLSGRRASQRYAPPENAAPVTSQTSRAAA